MKSRLKLVTPCTVNRTVTPKRPPNADLRTREYLTEAEVERLLRATFDWGPTFFGKCRLQSRPFTERRVSNWLVQPRTHKCFESRFGSARRRSRKGPLPLPFSGVNVAESVPDRRS